MTVKVDLIVWRKIEKLASAKKISPHKLASFYLEKRVGSTLLPASSKRSSR
jgi:hypothetical protein